MPDWIELLTTFCHVEFDYFTAKVGLRRENASEGMASAGRGMEAIIFIGVQGSGKTTFYREHFLHTHVRLSLDLLRTRHRQGILLDACLATQQRFVIDNTSVLRSERAVYIAVAQAARFEVAGYYFESELEDLLKRNGQRTGKQLIPAKGVVATFRRLEPPKFEEGFDRLYTVRIGPANEWMITSEDRSNQESQP
jgi:predicted kinase